MLRKTDEKTGRNLEGKRPHEGGETQREATRQRNLRDVESAINKGYRNKNVEEFFRK